MVNRYLSSKEEKEKVKAMKDIRKTIYALSYAYNKDLHKNDRMYFYDLAEKLQDQAFELKRLISGGTPWHE